MKKCNLLFLSFLFSLCLGYFPAFGMDEQLAKRQRTGENSHTLSSTSEEIIQGELKSGDFDVFPDEIIMTILLQATDDSDTSYNPQNDTSVATTFSRSLPKEKRQGIIEGVKRSTIHSYSGFLHSCRRFYALRDELVKQKESDQLVKALSLAEKKQAHNFVRAVIHKNLPSALSNILLPRHEGIKKEVFTKCNALFLEQDIVSAIKDIGEIDIQKFLSGRQFNAAVRDWRLMVGKLGIQFIEQVCLHDLLGQGLLIAIDLEFDGWVKNNWERYKQELELLKKSPLIRHQLNLQKILLYAIKHQMNELVQLVCTNDAFASGLINETMCNDISIDGKIQWEKLSSQAKVLAQEHNNKELQETLNARERQFDQGFGKYSFDNVWVIGKFLKDNGFYS